MSLPLVVDHHHIQLRMHVTFLDPTRYTLSQSTVEVLRASIKEHDSFHMPASYCVESSFHVKIVCHLPNTKQTD